MCKEEIAAINQRIRKEICKITFQKLSDEKLMPLYIKSKSVQKNIEVLRKILVSNKLEADTIKKIIMDYGDALVSPGAKGVIRGNVFNGIIKEHIEAMNLDEKKYEVCFEQQCKTYPFSEKPDWFIRDISTNRLLIGMNQVALWGGGHQVNRASKYILESKLDNKEIKLLCVVCNPVTVRKKKSNLYLLFKHGFGNNTLCYINNLKSIITDYFQH